MAEICLWCVRGICNIHIVGSDTPKDSADVPLKEEPRPLMWSKHETNLSDPISTGRKRAAVLYPLDRTKDCEWSNKINQGGGTYPIDGCGIRKDNYGRIIPVGKQLNRHHGPDKSTINNSPGNVHLICRSCHNQWHALNDETRNYFRKPADE